MTKVKVKRVLRVMRDRPEYLTNFMLVLNSLLFGCGSWIAITGLWLEVPVLIHHLPEGWSLASYLTFSIQLANIAPLIYWYLNRKFSKFCNEVSATNLQLLIGCLASITLIFYWETKVFIFDKQRSVVLLTCAFLLSIVDCLSSVTFLPFMSRFKSVYLTPYLIGEGLSGFLPTILAIIQNVEDNYNTPGSLTNSTENSQAIDIDLQITFGPQIFFVSLLLTLIISWIAFFYLQFHQPNHLERRNSLPLSSNKQRSTSSTLSKYILGYDAEQRQVEEQRWEQRKQLICQQEKLNKEVKRIVKQNQHLLKENSTVTIIPTSLSNSTSNDNNFAVSINSSKNSSKPLIKDANIVQLPKTRNRRNQKFFFDIDNFEYYYLQFLIFFACTITFGLMPPIQPFSCLPVSHSTLKYTVILAGLSYPVGCSFAIFFKCKSTKVLTFLTALSFLIASYIIYCALHSPSLPSFLNTNGSYLIEINDKSILNGTEYQNAASYQNESTLKNFLMHLNNNQSTILHITMVTSWVLFNLLLSYVKTMITVILNDKHGHDALFWVGILTQLGSVLGASFMFLAVNHFMWFKQK